MSRILQTFARGFYRNTILKKEAGAALVVKEVPSSNSLKIKSKQDFFQREDGGMPSYLKAGMKDKHLFNFTLLILGVGIVMSLETVMRLVTNNK